MKKSNTLRNVVLSLIALAVIVFGYMKFTSSSSAKADGSIEVTVVEIDGTVLEDKTIEFNEGDELVTLLENNFENVDIQDGFLYSIDELTTPADWSTWIALYVDGEMSDVGILEVEYTDGTVISFVNTEMSY